MLEEVRGSIRLVGLCSATGVDPHTHGRSLSPWRVLSGDLKPFISKPAKQLESRRLSSHTVNPLERVVDWVVDGRVTGEAKPRFTG